MGKQLLGVIGSKFIGSSPYNERSWSGSSSRFFRACKNHGLLKDAVGGDIPEYYRLPLILKNYSFDRNLWRFKFRLDTTYYDLLTRELARKIHSVDGSADLLQIGGIYDLPSAFKGSRNCYSYHDGNLMQLMKSPFRPEGVSPARFAKALQYEKKVYQGMNRIFTMSNYLRDSFIEDFQMDPSRVCCIGAGINLDHIPEQTDREYDRKTIVFIGIDFRRKGGDLLLQAFRTVKLKYKDARLHIIGPKALTIPREYQDGVVFHGFLSRSDYLQRQKFLKIMREAVLFVMPSLYEPFGIAPLEAMVHEIPCILPQKWAFPDMVDSGVEGELFNPDDITDLEEKMLNLIGNPGLLKSMGKSARERVLAQFTWDKVVSRLKDELEKQP
jgi:glycosyltransferase involved in cell wall biosynthesis